MVRRRHSWLRPGLVRLRLAPLPPQILGRVRRHHGAGAGGLGAETANAAHAPNMAALLKYVPISQVLFGTDYPYVSVTENVSDLGKGPRKRQCDSVDLAPQGIAFAAAARRQARGAAMPVSGAIRTAEQIGTDRAAGHRAGRLQASISPMQRRNASISFLLW
jgi:hypothetical protein